MILALYTKHGSWRVPGVPKLVSALPAKLREQFQLLHLEDVVKEQGHAVLGTVDASDTREVYRKNSPCFLDI